MKASIKILFSTFCISLFISCAVVKAPTGGPVDKDAPKLLGQTQKDSSVNFKGGTISFQFDERLNTSGIKINTFPLMKNTPQVKVNKRDVSIIIPDSLLEPNTTYKVSFGNTIKDIYEGNAVSGLDFTFSTGAYIDTMLLNGAVLQAENGQPDTTAWVALYTQIKSDSDITKVKPLYVSKVDAAGSFSFSNLPQKEFYIYAIGDKNANFLYDLPTESIAYLPTAILPLNNFSKDGLLMMRTFKAGASPAPEKDNKPVFRGGLRRVIFNIDTLDVSKRTYDITQPITINFGQDLTSLNKNKILLSLNNEIDATVIINYDSIHKNIKMNTDLLQDTVYTLQLLDGWAQDTSKFEPKMFKFRTKKLIDYGNLSISFNEIDSTADVYLQLFQGEKLIARQLITNKEILFKQLTPGSYTLNMLVDANKNGKWDNGVYFGTKVQPEMVKSLMGAISIKQGSTEKVVWK